MSWPKTNLVGLLGQALIKLRLLQRHPAADSLVFCLVVHGQKDGFTQDFGLDSYLKSNVFAVSLQNNLTAHLWVSPQSLINTAVRTQISGRL